MSRKLERQEPRTSSLDAKSSVGDSPLESTSSAPRDWTSFNLPPATLGQDTHSGPGMGRTWSHPNQLPNPPCLYPYDPMIWRLEQPRTPELHTFSGEPGIPHLCRNCPHLQTPGPLSQLPSSPYLEWTQGLRLTECRSRAQSNQPFRPVSTILALGKGQRVSEARPWGQPRASS